MKQSRLLLEKLKNTKGDAIQLSDLAKFID